MAERIWVIGVGPGGKEGMTEHAREAIRDAGCVYAARRHASLAPQERLRALEPLESAVEKIGVDWKSGRSVAVLVSGDAGLYSMLPLLRHAFGTENLRVIPGVSALQALCARLGETWQDARILSAHGRALSDGALAEEARTHASILLFCDAEHGPGWVADILVRAGLGDAEVAVGERLDSDAERIVRGAARDLLGARFDPLCVVRVRNARPGPDRPPIGLDDAAFERGAVPMTKKEVRVLALAALRLGRDSVVWDVGAGTGSVSIECARQCPFGRVYAVERANEALALIERNARKFHAMNLEIVPGSAPEALTGLPAPTHVFLGGTGGALPQIVRALEKTGAPVRLVATAVTLESAWGLCEQTKGWQNVEMTQLSVARLEPVGVYRMFKAGNPVFLFSADWGMK